MQEVRWASRWRGVASNEGAGKLKEDERDDSERQKERECEIRESMGADLEVWLSSGVG